MCLSSVDVKLYSRSEVKVTYCDVRCSRGERERLFGSRERDGKLKITFPFYGKGTGIRKCYGKGNLRLVIPGNPGNHIKSKDSIYFYALTSHPHPK